MKKYIKPSQETLIHTLTPLQFEVTQNSATERPFHNDYWNFFEQGIYVDVTTGEPLFSSKDKFESSCGWPSFSKTIEEGHTLEVTDRGHGMNRVEVRSVIGNAHLGHVFDDGPVASGGRRYCINSAAVRFIPYRDMETLGYAEYLFIFKKTESL